MYTSEFNEWDPLLQTVAIDAALADEMQRQTIRNILRSYTGYYDVFSELIQNALDACDMRIQELGEKNYKPQVWVHIDVCRQEITVCDNGIGLDRDQLKLFLQPNITFKKKRGATRGNKGVGATFLAYGYNHLLVATKSGQFEYAGVLENGRIWSEDTESVKIKPRMRSTPFEEEPFTSLDRGTTFRIRLSGDNVKPKNLNWISASTTEQWEVILRVKTPLGGIYFSSTKKPQTICHLKVTAENGTVTFKTIEQCEYYYPHEMPGMRFENLGDLIAERDKAHKEGKSYQAYQHLFRLHGIYDIFSAEEILDRSSQIKPVLSDQQVELMKETMPDVYVFFGYSALLWDNFNDKTIGIRQGTKILKGGLQLATQYMAQGELLVIPLTKSIGFQNQTHILVHFRNAEPDLGRKGFQPELVGLAERISTASVAAFKKYIEHLRKDSGEPLTGADAERYSWIKEQEKWAEDHPLSISGVGLFAPEEEIPIISKPSLEQDVVALFNQLLAGGVIRGFRILATSGTQKYDSVYRITITSDNKFVYDPKTNPLGIPSENISTVVSEPKILEYKYNVDALIADFDREEKHERHINLVVAWEMGSRWEERYQVNPLLHSSFLHRRYFHGFTHDFVDFRTGESRFYGIILEELIAYLRDRQATEDYLRRKYIDI